MSPPFPVGVHDLSNFDINIRPYHDTVVLLVYKMTSYYRIQLMLVLYQSKNSML